MLLNAMTNSQTQTDTNTKIWFQPEFVLAKTISASKPHFDKRVKNNRRSQFTGVLGKTKYLGILGHSVGSLGS